MGTTPSPCRRPRVFLGRQASKGRFSMGGGKRADVLDLLIRVAALILTLQAAVLHAQAPARIRLATLAPKGSSYHQILLSMGEKWRTTPGGGASLTIFAGESMGGEADMVRRMRVGQI